MSDRRRIPTRPGEETGWSDRNEMRVGFVVSCALHGAILAALIVGIPYSSSPKSPLDQVVSVDFVKVAEKAAAPKVEPPKPKPPEPKPPEPPKETKLEPPPLPAPPPPPPPPPEPPKQEVKPEPPKVEPPKPEPPPPPPKPQVVEAPKPEVKKPEPPPPPPPKKVEAPKPPPKPEPKKQEPPPKPDDFASVLKTIEKLKQDRAPQLTPPKPTAAPPPPQQQTALLPADQITGSEMDGVREQIRPCWNPNFGGRKAEELVVEIEVWANQDGTVRQAQIRRNMRMASDAFYQSAADAALRAVLNPRCAGVGGLPLKLPREKYDQWKFFVLVFDPKAMLGM